MQRGLATVEPFGEDRADVRAAWSKIAPEVTPDNIEDIWNMLTNYTGDESPTGELEADPKALAAIEAKKKNGG